MIAVSYPQRRKAKLSDLNSTADGDLGIGSG